MKQCRHWLGDRYEDAEIPDGCLTYSSDMDWPTVCPGCGRTFRFGDMYTSHEWHAALGMGYGVCEDCYAAERARRYGR